jgi:ferredoxin
VALFISDLCINCARCERECPVHAISLGVEYYEIDANVCVECIGFHDEPQCALVCPQECCIKIEEKNESSEV